jgi:broad specificity phosphatase PhoE
MEYMNTILFIRHAETDMSGTFCGHSDPELNRRGLAQLEALLEKLRLEDIGAVYTSDLRRARTTAMAIAKMFGLICHIRPALREINFGKWEGLSWEQIERRDQIYAQRWVAEYPQVSAPEGEDFKDFEQRVLNEVRLLSIEAKTLERDIAVVTHAGVIRSVQCVLQGCSAENAWANTSAYCSIVRHALQIRNNESPEKIDGAKELQGEQV